MRIQTQMSFSITQMYSWIEEEINYVFLKTLYDFYEQR